MPTACICRVIGSLPLTLALLCSWKHHSIYELLIKVGQKVYLNPTVNCANLSDSSGADTGPPQCHLESVDECVCFGGACVSVSVFRDVYNSVCAGQDAEQTLLMFLRHPYLLRAPARHSKDDITPLLFSPSLVTCNEDDAPPSLPPCTLPSSPLPHSLSQSVTHCNRTGRTNSPWMWKRSRLWSNSTALSALFWTLCPRAWSRYHNRINVYLSHSVTHSLSQVWQAGFAVNTSLERESVPDSRLWGFYIFEIMTESVRLCCRFFSFSFLET